MDIERVNDNTVKFYISYNDMEDRGYNRDEIWYDREKGEELFWDMLDEVNMEDDFFIDGPLWIQVQAFDQGLEVTVTKAQISKDGTRFELPISFDKNIDIPIDGRIDELLDEKFSKEIEELENAAEVSLGFVIRFADFEDAISLAHTMYEDDYLSQLYEFEGKYYLYILFDEELHEDEYIDKIMSRVLEFGEESPLTVHRLQEYGKYIMKENVFETLRNYFKTK